MTRGWPSARPLALSQLAVHGIAYAILTHAFVVQDFSVAYVADNSNTPAAAVYRYTAVWGAHEGSLLLWVLILALWTAAVARFLEIAAANRDGARAGGDGLDQRRLPRLH